MGAITGKRTNIASGDGPDRIAPVAPRIAVAPFDPSVVSSLVEELAVSPVTAAVLASRGLSEPARARAWLDAQESLEPGRLGETEAAELLAAAVRDDRVVAVHGDYDCDGVCSTAALTLGLRSLGVAVVPRVPERSDGYGLSVGAIDDLAATGAGILIAVDCGITAVEEVAHARALGLDVIVVDHHRPRHDGTLPDALIVHPNLGDETALPMCATAAAVALVRATAVSVGRELPELGLDELQALATVTDVMPLEGVNRSIVRSGLRRIPTTSNIGLDALIGSAGLDRSAITARSFGFAIGPRINAAGRVRAAAAALELLLTDDPRRAEKLAADLEAANAERRAIQQQTIIAAEQQALAEPEAAGWVLSGEGWHHGVVGIVAGSLASRYHRPTIVLAVDGDTATGSARSVPGYNVAEAIERCSHLLERHGGHSAAAGLTIRADAIEEFRTLFADVVDRTLPAESRVPTVRADVRVSPSELTLGLAEELSMLEPTGEGNPVPTFALTEVRCERPRRMGDGRHARFVLTAGNASSNAVAFDSRERIAVAWGDVAEVVGQLEINRWNGVEEPRFTVGNAVPGAGRAVGVLGGDRSWIERVRRVLDRISTPGVAASAGRELDRSGRTALGLLASLSGSGTPLCVVADVDRRVAGLRAATTGIDVVSWLDLELWPELAADYGDLVMLDPPGSESRLASALGAGSGRLYRAWGEPEVRFSLKVHVHEADIESRIRPFYAELRDCASGAPDAVLAALRGTEHRARPPRQVAWMLAVLADIGVVSFDPESLELGLHEPTADLASSPMLVRAREQLEEGRTFLTGLTSGSN